jgi:flavin-dependent dehydrogenase
MNGSSNSPEVIIAGAGPAGSSAAIHLANQGVKVLLIEQKQFPRAKLCGEFISPECRHHFRLLDIEAEIADSNPATLSETVFYSRTGRRVRVPSDWFVGHNYGLGLSRAKMDHQLLRKAKMVGVEVIEEASVADLLVEANRVWGVRLKVNGRTEEKHAPVTIDATGRTRALMRKLNSLPLHISNPPIKNRLVAFKVHLKNTRVASEACEIYSYRGGYGGLSSIEKGLSNLCFIAAAKDVRRFGSDPETVLRKVVLKNMRAAHTLANATICSDWLSVSLESFGRQTPVPFSGLLAVGDAAAFIDPFTGSGILMAFESGELASATILSHLEGLKRGASFDPLAREYRTRYKRRFASRFRVSGLLRRAAFLPYAAQAAIVFFGASDRLRRITARATRSSQDNNKSAESPM